jgi:hypothetical protein
VDARCTRGDGDVGAIVHDDGNSNSADKLRSEAGKIACGYILYAKLNAGCAAMCGSARALDETALTIAQVVSDGDETQHRRVDHRLTARTAC